MTGQPLDLAQAGSGELNLRVAKVQIQTASTLLAGLAVGDIAQALRMADQHELSRPWPSGPTA
jgi:hypothetical protein